MRRSAPSRTSATSSDSASVELAEGICDVINAKMAQAIRTLTVEKGIEPRDFALVAFGGAGPMHAVFLARELEIREVIVPPLPRRVLRLGDAGDGDPQGLQPHLLHPARRARPRRPGRARSSELEDEGFTSLEDEGITRETGRVAHARRHPLRRAGVHADDPADRRAASRCERGLRPEPSPTASTPRTTLRFGHANPGAPVEFVVVRIDGPRRPGPRRARPLRTARRRPTYPDRRPPT